MRKTSKQKPQKLSDDHSYKTISFMEVLLLLSVVAGFVGLVAVLIII